ncbi:hypothetical protein NKJ13_21670 [Mesorhizobium sp. M0174]|uniref:hypothetical protein n=1 Tax=Mesorhizobium sp. M0174 TaxID=2956904 RepID=UPI00333AB1B6
MPNALVAAAAEGLPSINRRQVLHSLAASSAVAAALVAAIPAAPAAEHPDADLFWLDQEMAEAEAQMNRANNACCRVSRKADKLYPPEPAAWKERRMPDDLHEMTGGMLVRDLAFPEKQPAPLRDFHRAREEQRAAHRALQDAFVDKVAQINHQAGVDAAEAAYSTRSAEFYQVGERILATQAHTLDGILVKLRAADRMGCNSADKNDALMSIATDIRHLAGEAV